MPQMAPYTTPVILILKNIPPMVPYYPCYFNVRENSADGTLSPLLFQYKRKFRYMHLNNPCYFIKDFILFIFFFLLNQIFSSPQIYFCAINNF